MHDLPGNPDHTGIDQTGANIRWLEHLIRQTAASAARYEQAADRARRPGTTLLLRECASERRDALDQLVLQLACLGGDPDSVLTVPVDESPDVDPDRLLAGRDRDELRAEYRRALADPVLYPDVRQLVAACHATVYGPPLPVPFPHAGPQIPAEVRPM